MRLNVSFTLGRWSARVALSMVLASVSLASSFKVIYSFGYNSPQGSVPFGDRLVFDAKGNLYGTTSGGGNLAKECSPQGCGTVFELSPSCKGWKEKVIRAFDWYVDGESPAYNLVLDPDGDLYGVTGDGPVIDKHLYAGAIFELSPSADGTWNETVLYKWPGGGQPESGLVRDGAGNLYGNHGLTFELSSGSNGQWTEREIGAPPTTFADSALTLKGGNLYDANGAGKYVYGMVYEFTPAADGTWQQHDLYDFAEKGADPTAGVVFDSGGNIYGATGGGGTYSNACWEYGSEFGCGTVFKLTPTADGQWRETVLHRFDAAYDGFGPGNTLTIDNAGNLYGVAAGGINGYGILFKLSPSADGQWSYSVIHRFTDAKNDGAWPDTTMVFDKQQKHLYGTTEYGGADNSGIVFEYTP